jgi:hypothetical protein
MRIRTNAAKKVCDMGACRNIAEYCIYHENVTHTTDICRGCLMKLYKGIKKVIYEKSPQKK